MKPEVESPFNRICISYNRKGHRVFAVFLRRNSMIFVSCFPTLLLIVSMQRRRSPPFGFETGAHHSEPADDMMIKAQLMEKLEEASVSIDAAFETAKEMGAENINARTVSQKHSCSTQPVLYHFKKIEKIRICVKTLSNAYFGTFKAYPTGFAAS